MLRLIKPYIRYRDVRRQFREVFRTGMFTKGKYVDQFKNDLREYLKCSNVSLTTSATTSLALCLEVLKIKPGDEVIVSDFSFPATANVVENIGAIPIFADVDLKTYNMMPEDLEKKITSKTKAVIFVDALGNPSKIHEISAICKKHNIFLIEDAACALGSSEYGVKNGNIADLTCFSFHPRKLLTTGEGGAVTTNDPSYANEIEVKLNHGAIFKEGKFQFITSGFNYRMTEMQAIMGIEGLKKLDKNIKIRNIIKSKYTEALLKLGFNPQQINNNSFHNVQSVIFTVPPGIDRDKLIQHLKTKDIESTIGTYCLSNTSYYKSKYDNVQPNSKFLEENTITLPCYKGVNTRKIIKTISKYVFTETYL
tara:strand:+ start:606 stop:1703 length:1098 start_codon:yes stop_codon:yes gene_type:complete